MKNLMRRLASAVGYEIRRSGAFEPRLLEFLASREIDTVLDVGANTGQFASGLRSGGYRGRIVSFEPVSTVFEQLRRSAAGDGLWEARNLGLGAAAGTPMIHVSEDSRFSSLLRLTAAAERFDASARVVREETIEVRRLDDVFDEFRDRRVFLKIDTQGLERDVLEGGADALTRILGLQAELPVRHFYEGVWSLPEALAYLEARGFVLAQVEPTNFDSADSVSMVELDCTFRRLTDHDRPVATPSPVPQQG